VLLEASGPQPLRWHDIDLRNWLFGFGAGIRIESPEALRDEHRQKLQNALEVYQPI
jgi:predicted DNA-binding transcriptional regulator YafY